MSKKYGLPVVLVTLLLSSMAFSLDYNFDNGTLQGWVDLTVSNPSQTEGPRNFAPSPPAWGDGGTQAGSGKVGVNIIGGGQDSGHPTLVLRSPEFKLNGAGDMSAWLCGGDGWLDDTRSTIVGKKVADLPLQAFDSPFDPIFPSFMGVALRNVNTGTFVLAGHKNHGGGGGTDWQKVTFTQAQLAALDQNAVYTFDLIDARVGGWGWIVMDTVTIPGALVAAQNPVPANGNPRVTTATASWGASQAFNPTTYQVWLNTEPNSLGATQVGSTSNTTVELGTFPGSLDYGQTYYWRVDVTDPNLGGTPIMHPGLWWSFTTASAEPYFTTQPGYLGVAPGATVQFFAEAVNLDDSVVTYQWFKRVGDAEEAVTASLEDSTLTINSAQIGDAGVYFCRATNTFGSTDSNDAKLFVRRGLVHRYSFSGDAVDSVNGANGSLVQGTGDTAGTVGFADGKLTMVNPDGAGSATPGIAYVDLPNGMISSLGTQLTIAVWVNPDPVLTWTRILDFGTSEGGEGISGNGGVTFINLVARANSNEGTVASELRFAGQGSRQLNGLSALPQGQESFVALTVNEETKEFKIYVDGALAGQTTFPNGSLTEFVDNNIWLGRAQYGDRGFNGTINELRIYDEALAPGWIAEMAVQGPDSLPENACVNPPVGDLTDDCRVDLDDLMALATDWLKCGWLICD